MSLKPFCYAPWSAVLVLALVACVSKPVVQAKSMVPSPATCVAGPMIPSKLDQIRPAQTAVCAYDFQEAVARIIRLATDERALYTVETVQHVFGLPEMTTRFDNPRFVGYSTLLSGPGDWRLNVNVDEGGKRTDQGPARFVPGLHPKRLFPPHDDFLNINFRVEEARLGLPPDFDRNKCVRNADLSDILIHVGWKDTAFMLPLPTPPTDGGTPNLELVRGNSTADFVGSRQDCFTSLTLFQRPRSSDK